MACPAGYLQTASNKLKHDGDADTSNPPLRFVSAGGFCSNPGGQRCLAMLGYWVGYWLGQ